MKSDARKAWLEKHPHAVAFMQAAHGVTVMQLHRDSKGWTRDLAARDNRRITARTPMDITGPARGHALMRTNADPAGTRVLGTFANCSAGKTPWGTYLTSEENVDDYFAGGATVRDTSKDAALRRRLSPLPAAREQLLRLGPSGSALRYARRTARAVPLRLDGGDRSARSEVRAAQAHLARTLPARRREHHRRARAATSSPTWATTRSSNTSTSS